MPGIPTGAARTQTTPKAWQPWLLSILVALLPLSFSIDLRLKVLPVAVLFLVGIGLIARRQPVRECYRAAGPVMAAALVMFGFIVLSALAHGLGWRPQDRAAHILLFLVIAAVFSQPLRMELVWGGFSLSAMLLGAACVVQHHVLGIERAYGLNGGASASIQLATVLLGLALLALVQLLGTRATRVEKVLHGGALLLAAYGALLTQSRGPLLAFAPMFALLLVLHVQRSGRGRGALLLAAVTAIGLGATLFASRVPMMERFEAIPHEVTSFDHRGDAGGAVRERLEMWRTAARAVNTHPWSGIGLDGYATYVQGEVAAGRSNPVIARYNQPHNEYLRAAVTGGIPGLLVLLLVFALPLRYFIAHLRDAADAVALPARAGVAVVGLYMLCALTDSVFYRVMSQSFYFFLVLGLAVLISRQRVARATSGRMGDVARTPPPGTPQPAADQAA